MFERVNCPNCNKPMFITEENDKYAVFFCFDCNIKQPVPRQEEQVEDFVRAWEELKKTIFEELNGRFHIVKMVEGINDALKREANNG